MLTRRSRAVHRRTLRLVNLVCDVVCCRTASSTTRKAPPPVVGRVSCRTCPTAALMNLHPSRPAVAACSAASASTAVTEAGVSDPDIPSLAPVTEEDYARVAEFIRAHRDQWQDDLDRGTAELTRHVGPTGPADVVVSGRLKGTEAIIAKMRRFGEPLRVMLDVWGYRLVVPTEADLDTVAQSCTQLWDTPSPDELLLRHGKLQFAPWRDYRKRTHAGLSPATTAGYDQAIHLNRRAPFGIVEIQVMTANLYGRTQLDPTSEASHERFVERRQELFRSNE